MNKTRIEWTRNLDGSYGYSWNVITGCLNQCPYCYAKKISMRFVGHFNPTFHPDRLDEPKKVKEPTRIFADSMSDFWGEGTKQEWRDMTYKTMKDTPQHTYFLLTKQPQNIYDCKKHPKNLWVGVSISKYEDKWRIPILFDKGLKIFVSLEPILDDRVPDDIYNMDWIILGCLTGCKNPYMPPKETIKNIINTCKRLKLPLFIKDNVGWHEKIQEYGV